MHGDRRILWLLVTHLACGPVCAVFARIRISVPFGLTAMPLVVAYALVLCQACLLGSWAALSGASRPKRLAGLSFGALYLGHLLTIPRGPAPYMYQILTPALASAMMAGLLSVVRGRWAGLVRSAPSPTLAGADRHFRFSIRGLMLLTLAVALAAAGSRSLRGVAGPGVNLMTTVAWGACFVSVSLSAVWAALGADRPALRGLAVLGLSGVVGALFAVSTDPGRWDDYAYFVTCHVLEATLFLGSLLVVRACGYRLVRRTGN